MRDRPNVHCLEGVDTLIVHLLSASGNIAALESFVQTEQQVLSSEKRENTVCLGKI